MKQQISFRQVAVCVGGLLSACSTFAQTDVYYQSHHWQLHTDAISQSTVVAFYDNHNQLIYQETLPGKHIRLTKKNIRRLDQTCSLLATNQLIASTIQPDVLTPNPSAFGSEPREGRWSLLGTSVPDSVFAGFRANVIPAPHRKIAVYYTQSSAGPVSIQLLDPAQRTVYQEVSEHASYKRYFDLEDLGYGIIS
ncbi:hypothetical protein [Larkinella knui]|uniref:Lipoprotein n=1 Tax=Larkinella knui TaxID=2025310 RepID=A0A3P1CDX1_9BACT|nr:hypothetical protein [Larkinella knui]RRB11512.1 hypothetical protein EHT87_23850 [Larkinella knui]